MRKVESDLVAAGRVAALIHQAAQRLAVPGVNLISIEEEISQMIRSNGMKAAFLGYKNYPAASCLSVNSAVVHAVPKSYILKSGDVLSVDLGVENNGWIVDTAWSHAIGKLTPKVSRLLSVTKKALDEGIKVAQVGNHIGDIGSVIQNTVESAGFYVIKELTGHGVGRQLQIPPTIPNYGRAGSGIELKEGMILAIEPITALQRVKIVVEKDNWTIRAQPNVVCAHFEHTIVVTKTNPIVLTKLNVK